MKRIVLCVVSLFWFSIDALPSTIVYTRNDTAKYGFIGIDDGAKDSRWRDLSPNGEYLNESPWLGYGHGNRCHQIFYFDFSDLISQLQEGEYFVVTDVSFISSEEDARQYSGGAEICPILVDWVSGQVTATWNNIEGNGTGTIGHGNAVQTGGRINNSQYSYPITGEEVNSDFTLMIENWLDGNTLNYGFLVRETADTTSSVDYHNQWELSITYEIVPEPTTLSLMALAGLFLRRKMKV